MKKKKKKIYGGWWLWERRPIKAEFPGQNVINHF